MMRILAVLAALLTALPLVGVSATQATETKRPVGAVKTELTPTRAPWVAPSFVRAIGARGSAGLYAWGVAYNPKTNEMLVGDYLNYQVRRFSTGGSLLGSFYRSAAQRRGQPEGIAVDPRDGSIYVSDHSRDNQGYIAKFTSTGTFVAEFKLNARYHAWITVDKDGYLYVSDSHQWNNATDPPAIRKYSLNDATGTATEVAHWGTYGTDPGQIRWITGITIDASTGRMFVADTINKRVTVLNADGSSAMTIGAGQFSGDLRGVAINERTRQLYVVDASSGLIRRFNADTGASLSSFGGLGSGPGEFGDGGRQLSLDLAGNVWVADYGNTRVLKFTATGTFIGAYPNPPQTPPAGSMSSVRDVGIRPSNGAVYAVEQNNHRVQSFRPDGTPVGMWGKRSSDKPLGFNYPRGLAVQPGSERVWVANTTSSSVRIYNARMGLIKEITGFSEPFDIEFGNGKAYVGDANGRNVWILNATTGAIIGKIPVWASGVAVDPQTGDIYASDWYHDTIYHFDANGNPATPASFGAHGTGPGQFLNPWDIDVIDGQLYVSDSDRGVIVVYTRGGDFVGEFGSAGSRAGQFQNPSGITHDASGKLYVADAGNDRVQVFDTRHGSVLESIAPNVTMSTPAPQAVLPTPVTLTGSVTDNSRVGTVELAIQDRVTKLWWDGRISTWGTSKQWTNAGLKGGSLKSQQWWFPFIGAQNRASYYVSVRGADANATMSPIVSTMFTTSG